MVEPVSNEKKYRCRFHENKLPKIDEDVVVEIETVNESGAMCKLLEYDDIQGIIPGPELTKYGVCLKSVQKAVKIGRQEVVRVVRVDEVKGYIDLSKVKVQYEDKNICLERYNNSKTVHSIIRTLVESSNYEIEDLYKSLVWPLYLSKLYKHPLDAYKEALNNPQKVFNLLQIKDEGIKEKLINEIKRRLPTQLLKCFSEFELSCTSFNGIDDIKEALKVGSKHKTPECELQIKSISAPKYRVFANCYEKSIGINLIKEALESIKNSITNNQGKLEITIEPKVLGEKAEELTEEWKNNDNDQEDEEEEDEGMDAEIIGLNNEEIDKKEEELKKKSTDS